MSLEQRELRKFGLVMAIGFAGFLGLIFPWVFHKDRHFWPFIVSITFLFTALLAPGLLKWVHFLWMKLAEVLGYINTRIILGILFFFAILPTGFFIRLFGRDPMQRKWTRQQKQGTYRILRDDSLLIQQMEKPY